MLKMTNDDNKRIVLIYCGDQSGCSHVRLRYYTDLFNGISQGLTCVISPVYIFDPNVLAQTKAIIWQKPANPQQLSILQRYKSLQQKFGYKLVYEIDDLFFDSPFGDKTSVPDYNPSSLNRTPQQEKELEETLKLIFPLFDTVMTSTDYLKKVIMKKYQMSNVVTVKNTVPRFLWSVDKKPSIKEDIVKPTVLYSGSPTHYTNPVPARPKTPQEPNGFAGIPAKAGDWDNAWKDWIIKNVKEDKINLVMMGAIPYFFNDITNKIKFIPWTNSYNYPRRCWSERADFQIAPLVNNEFNKCKSALRFYESTICGMVLLGNVFKENTDSPYEEIHENCKIQDTATVEDIDKTFWELCKKENYNKVLEWQYKNMNVSGMILESDESVNSFLKICDNAPLNLENI